MNFHLKSRPTCHILFLKNTMKEKMQLMEEIISGRGLEEQAGFMWEGDKDGKPGTGH